MAVQNVLKFRGKIYQSTFKTLSPNIYCEQNLKPSIHLYIQRCFKCHGLKCNTASAKGLMPTQAVVLGAELKK